MTPTENAMSIKSATALLEPVGAALVAANLALKASSRTTPRNLSTSSGQLLSAITE